jgi:hypothetical protein
MVDEPSVIYQTKSEEKKAELEKLYNKFKEKYCIDINQGKIIVEERRIVKDGIKIYPELVNGKIIRVNSLKPVSSLDIILRDSDLEFGSLIFETKDNEIIQVHHKHQ